MGNEPRLGSKVFYKIGEVSQVTKLPAYVLRFWESQFPFLKPKKSRGNQRLYVRKDVETVLEIKRMLYEEGHTLEGVKRYWTPSRSCDGSAYQAQRIGAEAAGQFASHLENS